MESKAIIDLQTAIALIADASREKGQSFFFYYGAGVSSPTVPLAEKTCESCLAFRDNSKRDYENRLDDHYTEILRESFTKDDDLSSFIHAQTKAKPSEAIQLLARILVGRISSGLAVTGNYDTTLEQAVRNMGEDLFVWDECPKEKLLPNEINLVYLQGSRREYRLQGLKSRLANSPLEQESDEKEAFLKAQLADKGCFVLGFSGREDNSFMRALAQSLKNKEQGTSIYWFLHQEQDYYALPSWLKKHPRVFFVGKTSEKRETFSFPQETTSRVLQVSCAEFLPLIETQKLTAVQVLRELVRELSVPLPNLISNPMQFLQTKQKHFLAEYGLSDALLIQNKLDGYTLQTKKNTPIDAVREKLLSFQYEQAAEALLAFEPKTVKEQMDSYLHMVLQTVQGLGTQKTAKALLEKALALTDKTKKGEKLDFKAALRTCLGLTLECSGDDVGALQKFQEVLDLLKNVKAENKGLDDYHDVALLHLSLCHMRAGRSSEAIAAMNTAFRAQANLGRERMCKAYFLATAGDYKVAHGMLRSEHIDMRSEYLDLLCLYSEGEFTGLADRIRDLLKILPQGAKTMHQKAVLFYLLADLESKDENGYPLKAWNKLINRYENAFDVNVRRIRAQALLRKAKALRDAGGYVEAIKTYDLLDADYHGDWDDEMLLLCAQGALAKAMVKAELGWHEEAMLDYQSFIGAYEGLSSTRAREMMAQGKYSLAALAMASDETEKAMELFVNISSTYDREESATIRTFMATSLLELAKTYRRRKEYESSLDYIDKMLQNFKVYKDNSVERVLSLGYLFAGETYVENNYFQEAVEYAKRGITRLKESKDSFITDKVGALYLVLVSALENTQHQKEAVDAASALLEYAADDTNLDGVSAKALAKRGDLLHHLGQSEEALRDYDRYVVRYGNEAILETKGDLLEVFYKRGKIQRQLGQNINAQRSLDQVVLCARELEDTRYDELLAKSYLDKAYMHLQDEQYDQQMVVLTEMEDFFKNRSGENTVIYRMQALYERAKSLFYRQKHAEALIDLHQVRTLSPDNEVAWEVFSRAAKMEISVLRKMEEDQKLCGLSELARLKLQKALSAETRKNLMVILREAQEAYRRQGNNEKLVMGAQNIVELFDQEKALDQRKNLARTRLERMEASFTLRDRKQVETDFIVLKDEIGSESDIVLKELLARATLIYADMMLETGEQKPAIDQYMQMQEIFGTSKGNLVDEYRSQALYKLGKAFSGIGSRKRAMKAYQELVDTYENRKDENTLIYVYKGLLELATLFCEKRFGFFGSINAKRAYRIYDKILGRKIPVSGEEGDKLVAKAMQGKAKLCMQKKKKKEAIQLIQLLIKTFETSEEPYVRSLVEKAQEDLQELGQNNK